VHNFAVTGVGGFVAPRHLDAIKATGNRLIAAVDPHDAVGVLDKYALDVRFFTEFERFDRHLEKLRRGPREGRVHFVTVCSPNYLHDAHVRLALRVGADAICEKPLAINPWNLDALQQLEQETGRRVYTILQLRVHPKLIELREGLLRESSGRMHDVDLTYITARGRWYASSWKGSEERSGGVVLNIGVHFFDLLGWLFGSVRGSEVHLRDATRAAGYIELQRARIRWYLSTEPSDLPFAAEPGVRTTFRSIEIDGHQVEFTDGSANLHTEVYRRVFEGRGFGIDDARPSIELARTIRSASPQVNPDVGHPWLLRRIAAPA
jgi:UDP-N-acetyl-2-amino-2-deoxyglucuronate dehydrogenase